LEKYTESDKTYFFSFLPQSGDYYDHKNIKGNCLFLIGNFLMLMRNGFKEYTFEYTLKKLEQLRVEAAIKTIICIINLKWQDEEKPYLKTLLLNALHCLSWQQPEKFENNRGGFTEELISKISKIKYSCSSLPENLQYFLDKICPVYNENITKRKNKEFDTIALKGDIIYSSIVGYCYVHTIKIIQHLLK
jgi:hypothetical protein